MNILNSPAQAVQWLRQRVTQGKLGVDSRKLHAGDGFIAWPGAATDGRDYVTDLLEHNIAACLVEKEGAQQWPWTDNEGVALYAGLKKDIAAIADLYYGHPSQHLSVLAVTGTNGKTSTSWWLAQAVTLLGQSCGVIGTLGTGLLGDLQPSTLTTPDPVRINTVLRQLVDQNVQVCAMEASSIGLAEHRFDDLRIKVALFTNLTQDHLDYHGDMPSYWQAKKCLFNWSGLEYTVVNIDDVYGAQLAQELAVHNHGSSDGLQVYTYSCQSGVNARLTAQDIVYTLQGMQFVLHVDGQKALVQTALIGEYNVSNLLGVAAALLAIGYKLNDIARVFGALSPVLGRMQTVPTLSADAPKVIVDYAHTPDALQSVLNALRPAAQARGGKLWCVFGCGGDRDAAKRPLMARVTQALADEIVITSDNPRTEDPKKIVEQAYAGVDPSKPGVHVEVDRAKAIALALNQASQQDTVLIAGKGHEPYQEIEHVRYPFSDLSLAMQILNSQALAKRPEYMLTLAQARDLLQSQGISARLFGDENIKINRVHSDTRTVQTGDLFVALRGENFDANDFLKQAAQAGVVAVLAERGVADCGVAGLEVTDAKKALGALGKAWRSCWHLPVIAVTGSNGKTTTTQMIASILKVAYGDNALATAGNLNNEIGVPLMLLRLRAHHQIAVFELGMNHPGEIERLAEMAQPTIALVTNAQREHQEFMSTVEAVAIENGQVIHALPYNGVAVFPADDAYTSVWEKMVSHRTAVTFALDAPAAQYTAQAVWDVDAWQLKINTPQGDAQCCLHIAGLHNVKNVLAAIACTQQAGVALPEIIQGVDAFTAVKGRSEVSVFDINGRQLTLVSDAYNANPDSVRAAMDVLATLPAPALFVLGEMGEVGEQGIAFHREVGEYAREKGVYALWGFGPSVKHSVEAFGKGGQHFEEMHLLIEQLQQQVIRFSSIVVKGSRSMKMERVVEQLEKMAQNNITKTGGGHVA